jgi:hypothetical protein
MKAWTVTIETRGGEAELDTVFTVDNMTADECRRGLVNHDGYDGRIIVREQGDAAVAMLDWNGRKGKRFRNQ